MGFNTPVLVLNDSAHLLPRDQDFSKRLSEAIDKAANGKAVDVAILNCANGCSVLPPQHADVCRFLAVGANSMVEFGSDHWTLMNDDGPGGLRKSDDLPVRVLKSLARQLGYSVRKSLKRRNP